MLYSVQAFAQDRTVTGRVTSTEDGTPIPGVNVLLKGTSNGTSTDAEGNYSLTVPASGGSLIFSFIGLQTEEIVIGDRSTVDISLALDATQLSEVIVVGYGTQSKRDISGSIASVSGEDIAAMPVQSFDQALQGRAAGVNVMTPNGVLNNPPVIRIRGVNSITLSSFPLVVIDGIPTFSGDQSGNSAANNALASINPADIESIEILKDASAAAIYGSRASAGVILVTTKRGKAGKGTVTWDSWVGFTEPFKLVDLLDAYQYLEIKNEGAANAGLAPQFFINQDANGRDINTDWYDHVYQTGMSTSNNLSFSGGTNSTTFYISVGRTDQEGMIQGNTFERTNARLNMDTKVNDWIKVGTIVSYTNSINGAPNTGSVPGQAFGTAGIARLAFVTAPIVAPYNNDGSFNYASNNQIGRLNNLQQTGFYNPVFLLKNNRMTSETDQIQASIYANWEPIKGLNLRTTYGIDKLGVEDVLFYSGLHGDGFGNNGTASNTMRNVDRWNWQNTIQYDVLLADKHNISALVGGEQQYTETLGWGATRTVLSDPFFETFQGGYTTINPAGLSQGENYLVSYFGRLNYDFSKKYFATLNVRRDGYSAFAKGKKYGLFYGGAVGYTISEEEFFKNSGIANTLNFLKVKASYGSVGNTQGIGNYSSLQLYGSGLYAADPTLFYSQAGNTELQWETSTKTDIGLNFGLFQDRIQGEVTYYKNLIEDMILGVPQSPSKGIPGNTIDQNIGSMENKGIEISLTATAIRKGDFTWTISANLTTLKNEVLTLAGSDIRTATSGLETANITRVGESIGSLEVVKTVGINEANGQRMFEKRDGTIVQYDHAAAAANRWTVVADGSLTTAPSTANDGFVVGPTLPTYFGGFDNTFKYKNIDLGIFFQFSGGNYVYNGTKAGLRDQRFWNNHTDVLDRWTPENPTGSIPRIVFGDNVSNGSAFPIYENVEKGDFIRARNIMLGYTFNKALLDKIHVQKLRVYAQVQNAFLITKYEGFDPEVSTNGNSTTGIGVDRNSVGQARTFTFGLSLGL
jgi:TonB-linked SusC/RagA family outer membrane protein